MTPTQTQLIVNAPLPVTVAPPDTAALVTQYTTEILPLASYKVETPEQYIQAKLDWQKAKTWATSIEKLFEDACDTANKAHKALTSLRARLKAPAEAIAGHLGLEIRHFEDEQERKRRAEEARLQAIENARREEERRILQAEADRKYAMEEQARQAKLATLEPWELLDDAITQETPPPVIVTAPEAAPVRLASSVPVVYGGPSTVDKPWAARVTDPVALLKWILENPEGRMEYIEFKMPELNKKAREHGALLKQIIPGVEAFRDKTLKRA